MLNGTRLNKRYGLNKFNRRTWKMNSVDITDAQNFFAIGLTDRNKPSMPGLDRTAAPAIDKYRIHNQRAEIPVAERSLSISAADSTLAFIAP